MTAPAVETRRTSARRPLNRARMFTVMRTDLKQLVDSKDFWVPMLLLGGFFFLIVPAFLLSIITSIGNVSAIQQLSQALELLPALGTARPSPRTLKPSTR